MFARFARDIQGAAGVPIGWFRGDEYGPLGGRLHMHALMLNTAHLPRMAWLNEWNRRAGFARILPFDPTKGAAFYCSKYVTKQLGDYDFSENIQLSKRRGLPFSRRCFTLRRMFRALLPHRRPSRSPQPLSSRTPLRTGS